MRILYLNSTPPDSQASVHVRQFAGFARRLGCQVDLVDLRRGSRGVGDSGLGRLVKGTPLLSQAALLARDLRALIRDRAAFRRLTADLRSASGSRWDLVYARPGLFDSVARRLAGRIGTPLFLEVNAPAIRENEMRGRPVALRRVAARWQRKNLEAAAAVFVVSRPLKEWLVSEGLRADSIFVTPNGVDPEKFHPDIDGSAFRGRFQIPDEALLFGFVGSFHPWQGAELLVEAFNRLCQSKPPTRRPPWLVLIGPVERAPGLRALLESSPCRDRVVAAGRLDHAAMPAAIAACDVCVAPFLPVEGFYFSPLKLFEYMAMQKAIVASDIGQIREVVTDSESALLTPPGELSRLVDAFRRVADDETLRIRLGKAALARSRSYTWAGNVRKVLEVFEDFAKDTSIVPGLSPSSARRPSGS